MEAEALDDTDPTSALLPLARLMVMHKAYSVTKYRVVSGWAHRREDSANEQEDIVKYTNNKKELAMRRSQTMRDGYPVR